MSASLVGSEMCIRDRREAGDPRMARTDAHTNEHLADRPQAGRGCGWGGGAGLQQQRRLARA
eukprot:15415040-Alexandrium_andersonii.AAC.1